MKLLIFFILFHVTLRCVDCFLDLSAFTNYVSSFVEDKDKEYPDGKTPTEMCDENQIMLQLARIYIISPERILLLLTSESLDDSCKGIAETLQKIERIQTGCIRLNSDNLYMKLLKALKFYDASVCDVDSYLRKKLTNIGDCLPELREEFMECEGSPDWYENLNDTIRCRALNDIANCNYVRTAMLCGLEPAAVIRGFVTELFQQVFPVKSKCKVSRSLPLVEDPMTASTNARRLNLWTILLPIGSVIMEKTYIFWH